MEYGSHHLEIQSQRHPDTGNWLLEDKNVYDWENTSLVRIFWLRGDREETSISFLLIRSGLTFISPIISWFWQNNVSVSVLITFTLIGEICGGVEMFCEGLASLGYLVYLRHRVAFMGAVSLVNAFMKEAVRHALIASDIFMAHSIYMIEIGFSSKRSQ